MSTSLPLAPAPEIAAGLPIPFGVGLRVPRAIAFYSAVAAFAALSIAPSLISLWHLWMSDPLKSVGMFIPPVSLVLILRAWRSIGWKANGTWYGLGLIVANIVLVWIQTHSILLLVISPRWTTVIPPPSLPLALYGAGVVLLVGGLPLFRAALCPICLLWFANPVPKVFSRVVDLPLQTLSAHVARSFAMHLGQPLTPDHLRLMFTPEFGMFIAPGCNGIRGALTMALIAVVAGYVYRFRWYCTAAVATGAVLLGYIFNLLRLCALVLYYIVALHFPSLQDKAETADYIIGAGLFLCASFLLFSAIHHLREQTPDSEQAVPEQIHFRYARPVALILVAGVAATAFASTMSAKPLLVRSAEQRFPKNIGGYTLVRTWQETLDTGVEVYQWAEYAPPTGRSVAIGISPAMSWHDPLVCHTIRGDAPVWQGPLEVESAARTVHFNSALYGDGIADVLDASTQCVGGACNEFATTRTHLGLVYTPLNGRSLLGTARSLPVILRAERPHGGGTQQAVSADLAAVIRSFVASADLADLARP